MDADTKFFGGGILLTILLFGVLLTSNYWHTPPKEELIYVNGYITEKIIRYDTIVKGYEIILNRTQTFYVWEKDYKKTVIGDFIQITYDSALNQDPAHNRRTTQVTVIKKGEVLG